MSIRPWLFPLILAIAGPLFADAAVSVSMHVLADHDASAETAEAILNGPHGEMRTPIAIPGTTELQLDPGVWYVQVSSSRWWSPERAWNVQQNESRAIEVTPLPAGRITGRFVDNEHHPLDVPSVVVKIRSDETESGLDQIVRCDVERATWNCVLPAGVHDIRLRPKGYVSVYRWQTRVVQGGIADFGAIELRAGASVAGRVRILDPKFKGKATVRIHPSLRAVDASVESPFSALDADVDAKGFFHFDGIAPGGYFVTAVAAGLAGDEQALEVVEGNESELIQPLVLAPPATLDVLLTPPLDRLGNRWRVKLDAPTGAPNHVRAITESAADATGSWRWRGAPGDYRISVAPSTGGVWARTDTTLGRDDRRMVLPVPSVEVRGTVRLGDRPLKATVHLGGKFGAISTPLQSDEEGAFSGFIARPADQQKELQVTIASSEPTVSRTLTVPIELHDETMELAIDLPETRLRGVVANEDGSAPEAGVVTIMPDGGTERFTQTRLEAGGMFVVDGLRSGKYSVSVETSDAETESVPVEIKETETTLQLTLNKRSRVLGQLHSPFGPVGGAEVAVLPYVGSFFLPRGSSNVEGKFAVSVPPATEEMDMAISAPGFARRLIHARYERGYVFDIGLRQQSGTLILDVPQNALTPNGPDLDLVHNRAWVPVPYATSWGTIARHADAATLRVMIPQMEPGEYQLCARPHPRSARPPETAKCSSGLLAPFGDLVLRYE
jgi:hypothetical protein